MSNKIPKTKKSKSSAFLNINKRVCIFICAVFFAVGLVFSHAKADNFGEYSAGTLSKIKQFIEKNELDSQNQAGAGVSSQNEETKAELNKKIDKAHIPFIENQGQIKNGDVRYYADMIAGRFFVTGSDLTYIVKSSKKNDTENNEKINIQKEENIDPAKKYQQIEDAGQSRAEKIKQIAQKTTFSFREQFIGADAQPVDLSAMAGQNPSSVKISDFKGTDFNRWKSSSNAFNSLSLGELWPSVGVSLNAYGKNIEKIFNVSPGANLENIKIKVEGTEKLEVNAETGELIIKNGEAMVSLTKPIAYQLSDNNEKIDLPVRYLLLSDDTYSFQVENYDPGKLLIIDPLLASTYIGGDNGDDWFGDIARDSSGNIFFTGECDSDDYPTTVGAWDQTWNGDYEDGIIAKFDPDLEELLASTFIGGTDDEFAYAITVDVSNKVWITGSTASADFPTTVGAWDATLGGTEDIFVSKFSNDLVTLEASTYLGGSSYEDGGALTSDGSGNIIVTGYTGSADYPTTVGAADTTYGNGDAFVTKLNGNLTGPLVASTYLGGTLNDEQGWSVKLDPSGNVFVMGETGWSTSTFDFPATAGAYDETYNGGSRDAFLAKLNSNLTSILAATHLGGDNWDLNMGVLPQHSMNIDSQGHVFLVSMETSSVFPSTSQSFDPYRSGWGPMFISKFSNDLSTLMASTFFEDEEYGGMASDWQVLDFDSDDNVIVHGYTNAMYLPTTPGAIDETNDDWSSSFYTKFDNDLRYVYYSTFLQSTEDPGEFGFGIAVDPSDNVYGSGFTMSGNSTYPTTEGAYDRTSISTDGYITKISMTPEAAMDHFTVHTDLIEDTNFSQGFEDAGFPLSDWTTGGDTNWTRTTLEEDEGTASAVSGAIADSQISWIDREYDFSADGYLKFKWKVDSEITYDSLLFCLDNDNCTRSSGYERKISGDNDWKQEIIPLSKGHHKLRWAYTKDGSDFWGSDRAWLDSVKFEYYTPTVENITTIDTQDFEAVGFPPADWTTGGNVDWSRNTSQQYEGVASAGSGDIDNSQDSWIDTDYTFPTSGMIKFNWKVSADSYDSLVFCIDRDSTCSRYTENDGVIAGDQDWAEIQAFVSAGTHSFRWMYSKDSWGSAGDDMGWIDNVRFETVEYSKDLETLAATSSKAVITAYDNADRKRAIYEGDKTITLSGAGVDGAGNHPTCTDKDGHEVEFGDPMTVTFANGVATCNMKLYKPETAEVEASDGTYDSTGDPEYHLEALVTGGVPGTVLSPTNTQISASPNPANVNNLVSIILTAYDESGNPYVSGGDTVALSVAGANTATPTVTDNGDGTYTASYVAANSGEDLITGTINGTAIGSDTDGTSDGTFHESITASTCVVDATKTTIAVAPNPVEKGNPATVTVTTYDSGGSICTAAATLTISVSGPESSTLDSTNNGDGTYTGIFTPQQSGIYTITATLGSQDTSTQLEVTEKSSTAACEKSYIDLKKSSKDQLKFQAHICPGEEASSENISKEKDKNTGLKKITLEAASSHGIDGQLKVKTAPNPQDILSHPSKIEKIKKKTPKKAKKLKVRTGSQRFKQSYLSGNYLIFKSLRLSPTFSQNHLEKGQLYLRVSKAWKNDNHISEIQFIRSDNRTEEILKSQKYSESTSDTIYKVTTTSKLSKYISIVGVPEDSIVVLKPDEPPVYPENPDIPESVEIPREPDVPISPVDPNLTKPISETQSSLPVAVQERFPSIWMEILAMLRSFIARHPALKNTAAIAMMVLPAIPVITGLNSFRDILLIFKELFLRLFGIFLSRKRKKRAWGMVYDASNGQPLPLANVSIINVEGRVIETKITDKQGIYYFLVSPGSYILNTLKKGYQGFIFNDASGNNILYLDDYQGGTLNIENPDLVSADIPMKPERITFWKSLMIKKAIGVLLSFIFWVGMAANFIIFILFPNILNAIILLAYILVYLLRNFSLAKDKWSTIVNFQGKPQSFMLIDIKDSETRVLKARAISDQFGRYLTILNAGTYLVEVHAPNSTKKKEFEIRLRERQILEDIVFE